MTEPLTKDTKLTSWRENELICEKLLRWKRATHPRDFSQQWFDKPYGDDGAQWHTRGTPFFDSWADAGLLMDEFMKRGLTFSLQVGVEDNGGKYLYGFTMFTQEWNESGPLAIRAAALEYVRSGS